MGFAGSSGVIVEIPPFAYLITNPLEGGLCWVGSLSGGVASKSVWEDSKGSLNTLGNRVKSAMAKGSLTERPTSRSGTKVEHSDPVVPYGRAIAQRIKGTPGITG